MASNALLEWRSTRSEALNEIAVAHRAVGGSLRGRRYATQQINRAYAVLLASQFQGFCRDLYTECVDHILNVLAAPEALRQLLHTGLTWKRELNFGNAQPEKIQADFGRLGIKLWDELTILDATNRDRSMLVTLNTWRNAIAHQDFDPAKLGGTITLQLQQVRLWRTGCDRLAEAFDEIMHRHLLAITGSSPW